MPTSRRNTCACRRRRCGSPRRHVRARRACAHDPRLRRGHAGRRARDARRPGARRQRSGGRRGVDAARRRRQGHLGAAATHPHEETLTPVQSGKWANLQRQDYIPSRLVENLYWLGRYTVRCENNARLLLRTLAARSDARVWAHARQICRDLGAVAPKREVFDALRTRECAGPAGRRQASRLVRIAGAQPAVGALLARRRRPAAPDAGGHGHARQQPRSLRTRAAVARRAHRLLRRRHDARRGLARDAPRPAHRAHAVRRQHPRAPAREPRTPRGPRPSSGCSTSATARLSTARATSAFRACRRC